MGSFAVGVLCLCFAAQRSFAQICEPVNLVDVTVLAREFARGAESLPVPALVENDQLAGQFQINYAEAVAAYGRSLMAALRGQAINQGKILTDAIIELANKLQSSIRMIRTNQGIEGVCNIEDVMTRIVKQFETFLSLLPGPGIPVQPPLPPLPVPSLELRPVQRRFSPYGLFVDYDAILDEISANLNAYTAAIFLSGWNTTWSYFDIYGLEIRNEILNDKVLEVYGRVASQINMECDFIENNVDPLLWESYRRAASIIEAEWNAYQLYKNQVTCIAILPY